LAHGLAHQVFLLATVDRRSRGETVGYAWQNLSRAVVALFLSVLAAQLTASALAVLWVDAAATLALAVRFFAQSVARAFAGSGGLVTIALRRLPRLPWRSALVLMTIGIVAFVQLNVDRWLAAGRLDVNGFAQYSFAWVVLSLAQSAQAVINASVYPALARRRAEHGDRTAFGACCRASVLMLALGIAAALLLSPLLQRSIDRWYPQYAHANALVPVFLAVGVLRVSDFWSSFLLIAGRERHLLLVNVSSLIVALVGWLALVPSHGLPESELLSVGWLAALVSSINYLGLVGGSWWVQKT